MTWWGLSLYSLACRYKHTCSSLVIANQTLKLNWRRREFWGMLQTTENTVLMVHLVIQLSNREGLATVLTLKYQVMREIRSKSLKVISCKWMQNPLTASVVIPINAVLGGRASTKLKICSIARLWVVFVKLWNTSGSLGQHAKLLRTQAPDLDECKQCCFKFSHTFMIIWSLFYHYCILFKLYDNCILIVNFCFPHLDSNKWTYVCVYVWVSLLNN